MSQLIPPLTDKEVRNAFIRWYQKYRFKDFDQELLPFLNENLKPFAFDESSWLQRTRQALHLSTQTAAQRANVSKAAYLGYESSEKNRTISLSTLNKAAEAMDCELVYAIRPKNRQLFSKNIWEILFKEAQKHPWIKKCDQRRRDFALASIALKKMHDPEFRRQNGWRNLLHGE